MLGEKYCQGKNVDSTPSDCSSNDKGILCLPKINYAEAIFTGSSNISSTCTGCRSLGEAVGSSSSGTGTSSPLLKKGVKRLSKEKLESILARKVMKLLESEASLRELQKSCLSLQQEVKDWKKRSNSLAKNSKALAELVKRKVIKTRKDDLGKIRSVNLQVGQSFLAKDSEKVKGTEVFKVPTSMPSHPAPLPQASTGFSIDQASCTSPPKLKLTINKISEGIQLFWSLDDATRSHSKVRNYEIFAYLETSKPPSVKFWKKIGDIKAIPLPIRCTLSQFKKGSKYHFSVRACDINSHFGIYSEIESVLL